MSNIEIDDYEKAAAMFKALSNPHRLKIFRRLTTCCQPGTVWEFQDNCPCVGELGKSLEVAPSTLSHHVKELKNAGILKVKRTGKNIQCSIDPAAIECMKCFLKP